MIDTDSLKAIDIAAVLDWLGLDQPSNLQRTPKIRCPLPNHVERTPSCVIYPATNSWYCFGCSHGGDTIDLVQGVTGLTFTEAVRWLAEHAGTPLGHVERPQRAAEALVEPVSAQAHADVRGWAWRLVHADDERLHGRPTVEFIDEVFSFYDETIRAYDVQEISAQEAIEMLIDWRKTWKARLT